MFLLLALAEQALLSQSTSCTTQDESLSSRVCESRLLTDGGPDEAAAEANQQKKAAAWIQARRARCAIPCTRHSMKTVRWRPLNLMHVAL